MKLSEIIKNFEAGHHVKNSLHYVVHKIKEALAMDLPAETHEKLEKILFNYIEKESEIIKESIEEIQEITELLEDMHKKV